VVYLGTGDDIAHKVDVLHAIERQLSVNEAAQPTLVDLRFPDTPYFRYPGEAPGG
jgi:hypothetical protein